MEFLADDNGQIFYKDPGSELDRELYEIPEPPGDTIEEQLMFKWDREQEEFYRPPKLVLTTDAEDSNKPVDGIPDIPADGESKATIKIEQRFPSGTGSAADEDSTLDEDADTPVRLQTTRGRLSTLSLDLDGGEATFELHAPMETVTAKITAEPVPDEVKSGSIELQFV